MSAIEQLADLCAQEDTVIFVGSGVSRWAGLPSWEGLIDRLADFLDSSGMDSTLTRLEAREGGLLQAASYGIAKLTKAQFAQFIRRISGSGTAMPAPIHEALMGLGPTCFITTNYDDLVEQAFRRWRQNPSEPQVVLNRQLVEQADISQTQARDFIFKPHGDARDVETVILSHEHYRRLMPGGEFNATLTTLTTLLVSRPVLFIGFGLRDPDFLFLRDLLANAYCGGVRDHYAIIADPLAEQVDWYRDHLGIHLIGYETSERPDGGRDHVALANMLASAGELAHARSAHTAPALDVADPARVLELARYGASTITSREGDRFVIRVRSSGKPQATIFYRPEPYSNWAADRLLHEGPDRLVLTGAPGAGKSFAIRSEVSRLGEALQDACLRGSLTDTTCVAIGMDLKLYAGDLVAEIDALLPPNVTLDTLSAALPVKLFLDSFNEAPRTHRESGQLDADIDRLLGTYPHLRLVIGSRTGDGLERLSLPIFELSEIEESEVLRYLTETAHSIRETHREEIIRILQRPFYFRLARHSMISLRDVHGPSDLYSQYLHYVLDRFTKAFSDRVPLDAILEQQAYRALEDGAEAFRISELKAALAHGCPWLAPATIEAVINWLIANDVLIPLGGGRASFVHQSITEYLAARRLVAQLEDRDALTDIILQRRWDNAIFLALGMIDGDVARSILQRIVAVDPTFAITGARYVEHKRDPLLTMLLEALLTSDPEPDAFLVDRMFEQLQFSRSHEGLLRQIADKGGRISRAAIGALGRLLGSDYKPELIEMLFTRSMNWNERQAMRALAPLITADDVATIVTRMLEAHSGKLDDEDTPLVDAVAQALSEAPQDVIEVQVYDRIDSVSGDHARVLALLLQRLLFDAPELTPLYMFASLAKRRLLDDFYPLYSLTRFGGVPLRDLVDMLDDELLEALVDSLASGDTWALSLLRRCCQVKPSLAERALAVRAATSEDLRALIAFSLSNDASILLTRLEGMAEHAGPLTISKPLQSVRWNELDWSGRHDLFVALLSRRDSALASAVLGGSIPVEINGLPEIDLGDPQPWIDWIIELGQLKEEGDFELSFLVSQLAFLCAHSSDTSNRQALLSMMESTDNLIVWTVGRMVMPYMDRLSIVELSDKVINNLLLLLRQADFSSTFRPHPFAAIADEAYVRNVLLPLAACSDGRLRANIAEISEAAGRRLGVRFILPAALESP